MFYTFTDKPFASNDQFGAPYEWITEDNVLANSSSEINLEYIQAIYKLRDIRPLFILDLGCGPGSFIEPFIKDGHMVVGLDGFFVNKKYQVGPWGRYPNNFFNCDIAEPFRVCYDEYARIDKETSGCKFDIVTTFEFMEHLYLNQLPTVFHNILNHMKKDGVLVAGISFQEQSGHFIVKNRSWWLDTFKQYGFVEDFYSESIMESKYQKFYPTTHFFCFKRTV